MNIVMLQCGGSKNLLPEVMNESITILGESDLQGSTKIRKYAFYRYTVLSSIIVPSTVTTIETYAFGYCSGLTSVVLPENITNIGQNAFAYCNNLTNIVFNGSVSQWSLISKGVNWSTGVPATSVYCVADEEYAPI